jgi:hypothetical protein
MRATMKLMLLSMETSCQVQQGGPPLYTNKTSSSHRQTCRMQQQQTRQQLNKRLLWTSQHLQISSVKRGASSRVAHLQWRGLRPQMRGLQTRP